jgi:hypothetical protein
MKAPDPDGPRVESNFNDRLLVAAAIALSLGGIAGFIYLFVLNFNIYWLILSPVIFAVYQLPSVYLFWLYRRRKAIRQASKKPAGDNITED